jgi:7,8-dihydropterin-6-yl-methyl-4-(beta-D-ribofuranosyl)aminobenzene 5'-phosphate synthase
MQIKITTLVDNQAATANNSLIHEHGLSMIIQTAHESILFDTGCSDALLKNARRLGIDVGQIQKVIISHCHLDHAGGVKYLIDSNPGFTLMAHPGIFAKKIIRSSGTSRNFGISEDLPALKDKGIRLDLQEHAIVISENILTTGHIPMKTDFEEIENRFFTEENGDVVPDSFEDEKALIIQTSSGTVVLSGCSHRGIINTLHHVAQVTGNDQIYAVMGGLHIGNAHPSKIEKVCNHLERFGIERIIVGHCTGVPAITELVRKFGDKVEINSVGKTIEL